MLAAAARVPRAQLARFFSAVPTIKNVINGEFVESKTTKWVDIHNPGARALLANLLPRQSHSSVAATNELIARAPCTTQAEMQVARAPPFCINPSRIFGSKCLQAAVDSAAAAFPSWRQVSPSERQRIMFK